MSRLIACRTCLTAHDISQRKTGEHFRCECGAEFVVLPTAEELEFQRRERRRGLREGFLKIRFAAALKKGTLCGSLSLVLCGLGIVVLWGTSRWLKAQSGGGFYGPNYAAGLIFLAAIALSCALHLAGLILGIIQTVKSPNAGGFLGLTANLCMPGVYLSLSDF